MGKKTIKTAKSRIVDKKTTKFTIFEEIWTKKCHIL